MIYTSFFSYHKIGDYYKPLKGYSDNLNIRILALEYPGFGISNQYPSNEAFITDWLYFFLKYIESQLKIPYHSLSIMGYSLGTGVVVDLVYNEITKNNRVPNRIVLIGAYIDARSIVVHKIGNLGHFMVNRFNTFEKLSKIDGVRLYLVHGDQDNVVPIKHAEMLYNKYKGPKKFIIVHNSGHIFPDPLNDVLLAFSFFNVS